MNEREGWGDEDDRNVSVRWMRGTGPTMGVMLLLLLLFCAWEIATLATSNYLWLWRWWRWWR